MEVDEGKSGVAASFGVRIGKFVKRVCASSQSQPRSSHCGRLHSLNTHEGINADTLSCAYLLSLANTIESTF
jgi:hypothetical protein